MSAAIKKPPSGLLLNISGWQRETATLSAAERGALLSLKMHLWSAGPIPDNDRALARICCMDAREWKDARGALEPRFLIAHGEWQRPDWNDELEAAYRAVRKAQEKSQKGHRARWGSHAPGNAPGNAADSASGMHKYKGGDFAPCTPTQAKAVVDFSGDVALAERTLLIGGAK